MRGEQTNNNVQWLMTLGEKRTNGGGRSTWKDPQNKRWRFLAKEKEKEKRREGREKENCGKSLGKGRVKKEERDEEEG